MIAKFIYTCLFQGTNLVWESYKLDTYVQRLAEAIFNFQEKMDDLVAMEEEIEVEVRSLDTCAYIELITEEHRILRSEQS